MTSELGWLEEDDAEHLCDTFGCVSVATVLWTCDVAGGQWHWHLCRAHTTGVGRYIATMVQPDTTQWHRSYDPVPILE